MSDESDSKEKGTTIGSKKLLANARERLSDANVQVDLINEARAKVENIALSAAERSSHIDAGVHYVETAKDRCNEVIETLTEFLKSAKITSAAIPTSVSEAAEALEELEEHETNAKAVLKEVQEAAISVNASATNVRSAEADSMRIGLGSVSERC